jgi:hypothetical protein
MTIPQDPSRCDVPGPQRGFTKLGAARRFVGSPVFARLCAAHLHSI